MLKLAVITVMLMLLMVPAAASGQGPTGYDQITNAIRATDPIMAGAVAAADQYWTRIGRPPTSAAEAFLYDDADPDANARAEQGGSRLWITRRLYDVALLPGPDRRRFLRALCGTIVHERGHNIGLTHDAPGIMQPNRDPLSVPRECWEWARSVVPRRPPRTRRANIAVRSGTLTR